MRGACGAAVPWRRQRALAPARYRTQCSDNRASRPNAWFAGRASVFERRGCLAAPRVFAEAGQCVQGSVGTGDMARTTHHDQRAGGRARGGRQERREAHRQGALVRVPSQRKALRRLHREAPRPAVDVPPQGQVRVHRRATTSRTAGWSSATCPRPRTARPARAWASTGTTACCGWGLPVMTEDGQDLGTGGVGGTFDRLKPARWIRWRRTPARRRTPFWAGATVPASLIAGFKRGMGSGPFAGVQHAI